MPLFQKINAADGTITAFWEITESEAELLQLYSPTSRELEFYYKFKTEKRKHFLATRVLAAQLFPDSTIEKDAYGKPYFPNLHAQFSWAHSGKFAAFTAHPSRSTGIDIEILRDKIAVIAPKFCNSNELEKIHSRVNKLETLTLIWGCKECMYKFYGKKEIDFKEQMLVFPFDYLPKGGLIKSKLRIGNKEFFFELNYLEIEKHLAVWISNVSDFAR